jgi:SNF2 family DNA or RNA helicase
VLQRHGFGGGLITILDALLKLRQVCDDPHLLAGRKVPAGIESAKRERLRELLPSLVAEGRRVLVFSQFTAMLALLRGDLEALGISFLSLTGETPAGERGATVRAFQSGSVPVMLLSLKAGGVGLNLTAADTVIHVDPWWNPAVERQATDRAHRIGQQRPVFVHKIIVAGSIEERILELQARKGALAEGVLGEDGGLGMKFSAADLDAFLAPLS